MWSEFCQNVNITGIISTNWSCSGGIGQTYGFFETTLFPSIYSLECWWYSAISSDDFLKRFLRIFHGLKDSDIEGYLVNKPVSDYFTYIHNLPNDPSKNSYLVTILDAVSHMENGIYELDYLYRVIYRSLYSKKTEGEMTALRNRFASARKKIVRAKQSMENCAVSFLHTGCVKMYLKSKFFFHEQ